MQGCAVVRIDVKKASAHPPGDGASTVVFDGVAVVEAAAESAVFDLLLVPLGGGPPVKDRAEDGACNSWCHDVGEFGEEFGGPLGLPGRRVLSHIG